VIRGRINGELVKFSKNVRNQEKISKEKW
jgi:hypothetical protein